MQLKHNFFAAAVVAGLSLLPGCSADEPDSGEGPNPAKYELSGQVEKGPFIQGSKVSVQPLDGSLSPVGSIFNGEIQDDRGFFDIGQVELDYPYARLTADGYFFNEVNGLLSDGTIRLNSIVDLSNKSTANVNLLTHLKAARILKLVASGKYFTEADAQAQREVLTQFGLQRFKDKDFSSASITDGSDGAGIIIAVSSLLLNSRSEAEFTEFLSQLSTQLAYNGEFSEDSKKKLFADIYDISSNLTVIADHIVSRYKDLGKTVSVPDLRYYFDWNCDGIAGNEINDNPNVTLSQTEVSFGKEGGTAEIIVSSNVKLSLERFENPYHNDEPGWLTPGDDYLADFYEGDLGNAINCESTYENGVLKIAVAKTERRSLQKAVVNLYDMMGEVRATVNVSLAGDPSINARRELGKTGRRVVNAAMEATATALSWMYYIERGYTGMYGFHGIQPPMNVSDDFNYTAFRKAYQAVAPLSSFISDLERNEETSDAAPVFRLYRAIIYAEMADKWGNIGIYDSGDYMAEPQAPVQSTPAQILAYAAGELSQLSAAFYDEKASGLIDTIDKGFFISKDVWRAALANVYMQQGNYADALSLLQEIIDTNYYSLQPGNDYSQNAGSIFLLFVPDEVVSGHIMGYYTYTDAMLDKAECLYHQGDMTDADKIVRYVASTKAITVSGDLLPDIATIRKSLFIPHYFAFQKRNNLGRYEDYQKLWPIPAGELSRTPSWHQNPGY